MEQAGRIEQCASGAVIHLDDAALLCCRVMTVMLLDAGVHMQSSWQ
jgi:hypothetical protein